MLVLRLRAAAHALFPLAGEEKKSQVEAESHLGRRYQPDPFDAGILCPMSRTKVVAQRSRWPFISLIPLGLGAWAPIYAGQRAQQRSWILWGVLWTVLAGIGFILAVASNGGAAAGLLIILGWAGSAATSFSIRGAYDRQLRSPLLRAEEEGERRLRDRRRALQLARENPDLAREIGVGRPDEAGATHAGLVDVNNASVSALLKLPGVDGTVATEIIETRAKVGGFSSLEDLGETLDLDGALVEGLRGEVVFLPRVHSA
jgi:Helix-hairpin-helix motif